MRYYAYIMGGLFLILVMVVGGCGGRTWIVDDDWAGADFDRIQDAVDSADPDDVIRVYDGRYHEQVVVDRNLSLIGNGSGLSEIESTGKTLDVNASFFQLDGFSISSGRKEFGIELWYVDLGLFSNLTVNSAGHGFRALYSGDLTFRNCNMSAGTSDIGGDSTLWVWNGGNISIEQSMFSSSDFNVRVYDSDSVTIDDCQFDGGRSMILSGNDEVIVTNVSASDIRGDFAGIYTASRMTISNVTVTNSTGIGIRMRDIITGSITDSYIGHFKAGLIVSRSNIEMTNTVLIDNHEYGISPSDSNLELYDCIITGSLEGIRDNAKEIFASNCTFNNSGIDIDSRGRESFSFVDCSFNSGMAYWTVVNIDKIDNCSLKGDPITFLKKRSNIQLDGGEGQVILLNCTDIEISNWSVIGGYHGMYLAGCERVTISNCSIEGTSFGIFIINGSQFSFQELDVQAESYCIFIEEAESIDIQGTSLSNGTLGLRCDHSDSVTLSDSQVYSNSEEGIYIRLTDNVAINNCSFFDNGRDDVIISLGEEITLVNCSTTMGFSLDYSDTYTLDNCTVQDRPLVILKEKNNSAIGNEVGQLIMYDCHNISIESLALENIARPIKMYRCNDILISNSSFLNISLRAIYGSSSDRITIENCTITGCEEAAVLLSNSDQGLINNTSITKTVQEGIQITGRYNTISNCTVDGGFRSDRMEDNYIHNTSTEGSSILLLQNLQDQIFIGDIGQFMIYYCENLTIVGDNSPSSYYGSYIHESNDIRIRDLTISNTTDTALLIERSEEINIENVSITDSGREGIMIENTRFVEINNSMIIDSRNEGLLADYSSNATLIVRNSNISFNGESGIMARDYTNLLIENCTFSENEEQGLLIDRTDHFSLNWINCSFNGESGLEVDGSLGTLKNATLSVNYRYGCEIDDSSITMENITVTGNDWGGMSMMWSDPVLMDRVLIEDNDGVGAYLYVEELVLTNSTIRNNSREGLTLVGDSTEYSIHHNNFIDNNNGWEQCTYDSSSEEVIYLDNGSHGNYWSTYGGTYEDDDGVGDQPHIIEEDIVIDRYPMMEPWGGSDPRPTSAIWIVDDDWAGANFSTIGDALNASVGGELILVYDGQYSETINIDIPVRIKGNGTDTVLSGIENITIINVETDQCSITDLVIEYHNDDPRNDAIEINGDHCKINDVKIINASFGITANGSYITLKRNEFVRNRIGIDLDRSSYVDIDDVLFDDTQIAVNIDYSSHVSIINCNHLIDSGISSTGISIYESDNIMVSSATLQESGISGYRSNDISISNTNISGSWYGVDISFSDKVVIEDVVLNNSLGGLEISRSDHVTLLNISVDGSGEHIRGIVIANCNDTKIQNVRVNGTNNTGFDLRDCSNLTVQECLASNTGYYGFEFDGDMDNVSITSCEASHNDYSGLRFYRTKIKIVVDGCYVHNNTESGIYIYRADNITVTRCLISDNDLGVEIGQSTGTVVYNNQFYGNSGNLTSQAAEGGDGKNYWDNGTIGNYWSDYTGYDINNDGIGEVPYVIGYVPLDTPKNNTDRYPLTEKTYAWDSEPPTVSIDGPMNGTVVTGNVTIEGSASDNRFLQIVQYRIDNGTWKAVSGTSNWSLNLKSSMLPNGSVTIDLRSFDGIHYSNISSVTLNVNKTTSSNGGGGNGGQEGGGSDSALPIIPIGAGIGASLFLMFLATETGRYALFAGALAAYARMKERSKDEVLDNFVRGQIYGYLTAFPGSHYGKLKRALGITNGTLSHHLYTMEKMGLIKSRTEGLRYKAFYITGMKFPEEEKFRLTDLQVDIIKLIEDHPGIFQKEVAKTLEKPQQTVNYNIKMLERVGKVRLEKEGRLKRCYSDNTE